MKKILCGLFLIFVSMVTVNAQPPQGMGQSDPEAKKILDGVSTKFKSFKSVVAKFVLKIEIEKP